MAFGTWRSSFPQRLGANSAERVTKIYDQLHANLGALSTAQGTINDADTVAAARLLSLADRAIDRRVGQMCDPRTLTDPLLSRWERILGIMVSVHDTDLIRRNRVAARLLAHYDARSGAISSIAAKAFSPWTTQPHFNNAATAVMSWPGNGNAMGWTSSVANLTIEYVRPVAATDADAKARVDACRIALDDNIPAWCTFNFHETGEGQSYGFLVGISKLGIAVL